MNVIFVKMTVETCFFVDKKHDAIHFFYNFET